MKTDDVSTWRSAGSAVTRKCPKCGEDSATQLETTIYRKTRVSLFCNTCAHSWVEATDGLVR